MTTTTTTTTTNHNNNMVVVDYDNDEDPLKDFSPLTDALVYAMQENNVEVMPKSDVTKIRVLLKESFNGIPLPLGASMKKQKKIDKSHPHYQLAVGMMMGIRETVGGMDGLLEADFDEEDFRTDSLFKECRRNRKYSFQSTINGAAATTAYYQFKAYAPLVFARIRSNVGIDKNLFLHSVCGNFRYLEFMSNAKSGSFFFFSHDGQYLIKTLTVDECHFLVKILPSYYHYVAVNNPNSFLTRFYGLYRLVLSSTTSDQTPIYFSIMKSVFDTPNTMANTYDLKGSTLGRSAKPQESVKKDLDIMREGRKLEFSSLAVKEAVLRQLKRDATFLARLGIMDYSFLVGIHEKQQQPDDAAAAPSSSAASVFISNIAEEEDHSIEEEDQPSEVKHHDYDYDDVLKLGDGRTPDHQDEFVDWETLDWIPCMEDCSVNTSVAESVLGPTNPPSLWNGSEMEDGPCPFSTRADGGIDSLDKRFIYYAGIIDILQPYNNLKWGETVVKMVQGNAEEEISCVDPETYGNRFIKFLSNLMKEQE